MGEEYERFRSVSFGERALGSVEGKHVDLKIKSRTILLACGYFFALYLDLKCVLPNSLLHAQQQLSLD